MDEFWGAISEWLTGTSDMRQWDWGSTADWVTGLLTAAAVVVAAQTYRHERMRADRVQANPLKARRKRFEGGSANDLLFGADSIIVSNDSDYTFNSVWLFVDPSRFAGLENKESWRESVLEQLRMAFTTNLRDRPKRSENFRTALFYWRRYPKYSAVYVGTVGPRIVHEIKLPRFFSALNAALEFEDAEGRVWTKRLGTGRFYSDRAARRIREGGEMYVVNRWDLR